MASSNPTETRVDKRFEDAIQNPTTTRPDIVCKDATHNSMEISFGNSCEETVEKNYRDSRLSTSRWYTHQQNCGGAFVSKYQHYSQQIIELRLRRTIDDTIDKQTRRTCVGLLITHDASGWSVPLNVDASKTKSIMNDSFTFHLY